MPQILWMAEQLGIYAIFSPINSGLSQVNPNFIVQRHLLFVINGVSFGITVP
jgi:hypothetical protein